MQADKLKLRENEVVHASTFSLASKVCELADKLGLKWRDGVSYMNRLSWEEYGADTCYNFHIGSFGRRKFWLVEQNKTIISATEWLNRHGIFVYGQEVWVGDEGDLLDVMNNKSRRLYVTPFNTVALGAEEEFKQGRRFSICSWDYIVPTFPAWESEPEKVRFVLGDKETMISAESAKAIKDLMN